jgi:hypothetical protein
MGFAGGTGPMGRTRWLYPSYELCAGVCWLRPPSDLTEQCRFLAHREISLCCNGWSLSWESQHRRTCCRLGRARDRPKAETRRDHGNYFPPLNQNQIRPDPDQATLMQGPPQPCRLMRHTAWASDSRKRIGRVGQGALRAVPTKGPSVWPATLIPRMRRREFVVALPVPPSFGRRWRAQHGKLRRIGYYLTPGFRRLMATRPAVDAHHIPVWQVLQL